MADLEIVWKGITLGGTSPYVIQDLTGWDELPGLNDMSVPQVRGHGDHLGDQFSQARTITLSGTILADDSGARDTLSLALQGAATVRSDLDSLAITTFNQQLFTDARIVRSTVSAGATYGVGAVPFALQWKCPDPLRYGPLQSAGPVGLPVSGGGLAYPLAYPLDYGTAATPGLLSLTNVGTADSSVLFTVTGALPSGFEISSASGKRLTYPDPLFSGDVLTLDTATGAVLLGGTADRRASLTVADWMQVPAGGSITVRFSSLGGAFDAAATLTASMRPAYW